MNHNVELGRRGEQLAVDHLRAAGLVILDRNWRCRYGEVDIVARDGATLVVCEVKTRSSLDFGHPAEAITPRKLRRLRHLAFCWLDERQVHAPSVRIDVVCVLATSFGDSRIEHLCDVGPVDHG